MENFNELQALITKKETLAKYIAAIHSIRFDNSQPAWNKEAIVIGDNDNRRLNFTGVEKLIGKEKLQEIIQGLIKQIDYEMLKVRSENDYHISQYSIVKDDRKVHIPQS